MSRIGKLPVMIPAGVDVTFADSEITVKGPKGELKQWIDQNLVNVNVDAGVITVTRDDDAKEKRSAHGLYRTLISNMVTGVTEGFEKKLQIVGVGYRCEKKGDTLVLNLGYSHPVEMKDPEGITTEAPSQTDIIVRGISKELVGNYSAVIRQQRPPEPYKGKGIKYVDETIIRKEGKSGAK